MKKKIMNTLRTQQRWTQTEEGKKFAYIFNIFLFSWFFACFDQMNKNGKFSFAVFSASALLLLLHSYLHHFLLLVLLLRLLLPLLFSFFFAVSESQLAYRTSRIKQNQRILFKHVRRKKNMRKLKTIYRYDARSLLRYHAIRVT